MSTDTRYTIVTWEPGAGQVAAALRTPSSVYFDLRLGDLDDSALDASEAPRHAVAVGRPDYVTRCVAPFGFAHVTIVDSTQVDDAAGIVPAG